MCDEAPLPSYTANDGGRLHVETAGEGPPVVLIHGFASSSRVFARQVEALAPHFTVYAPDLRGHGRSAACDWGGRIARLSRDLHDLIEAEGLDEVRLVAWSMGCSVAWSYLDLFGDARIAALAFIDEIPWVIQAVESLDGPCSRLDSRPLVGLHDRFARAGTRQQEVRDFIAWMLRTADEEQRRTILDDAATATPLAVSLLLNSNATDWRDVIMRIRRPTLFVGATESFFHVAFHEWMHRQVPGSRLAIRAGAGHFLPVEEAAWLNGELLAFFGIGPSGRR